ncbi:HAD family hydrolase [Duganella sp. HH101]|uniref:HAD family hydrolase n=1 Tax=Duganella sp. HH101 TaxID=1781066 RepID=UPI000874C001|nr:HAD hydrolase-like protein [Duganella sp. HH101]OFA00172.1 phosphoglycolate phosphatase [Duganella sp. HH101]
MYNFLIFDLDDTLAATGMLEHFRGAANVGKNTQEYSHALRASIMLAGLQPSIPQQFLLELKAEKPHAKFAVVTTSPVSYALTLLDYFYPQFAWDAVVGYENVARTKPDPEGLYQAFERAGCDPNWNRDSIVLIGDSIKDVTAAYRSGIRVILYTACWPQQPGTERFKAANLLPDAQVKTLESLRDAIDNPNDRLPAFELAVAGAQFGNVRSPKINHFCNHPDERLPNGRSPSVSVYTLGRLFAEYKIIAERRAWHLPTQQIHDHKNASRFPTAWVIAILQAVGKLARELPAVVFGFTPLVFTCIPRKPNRPPRLELLLQQVQAEYQHIGAGDYEFAPAALVYDIGALSHHGEHLKGLQRFENARDFLRVANPEQIRGKTVVVLDDVVTSGASLFYADKKLKAAGANSVICLALTQTIGEV